MKQRVSWAAVLILGSLAAAAEAATGPVTVSPGDGSKLALIENHCPTFSWSAAKGATGYELVVYSVGEDREAVKPVLRESFEGSVLAWTPSLGRCLERGGRYAWSVRALGTRVSDWSSPSPFAVTSGPSQAEFEAAVDVVRSYLAGRDDADDSSSGRHHEASRSAPAAASDKRSHPRTTTATQLDVEGNIEATSFTGDGSNLAGVTTADQMTSHATDSIAHHAPPTTLPPSGAAGGDLEGTYPSPVVAPNAIGSGEVVDGSIEEGDLAFDPATQAELDALAVTGECEGFSISARRYLDRGDGTVRDCNTGHIWLKDAACLGRDSWEDTGDGTTIFTRVADLNSGTDFGCSGYTSGTYSDWVVPRMSLMCGGWAGEFRLDCRSSEGLAHTGLPGSPKVLNGAGTARWTPGNVFVGVQSSYWSASDYSSPFCPAPPQQPAPPCGAWYLNLRDGIAEASLDRVSSMYVWPVRSGQ